MSAADHTLRELAWMAEGRGLLTAWHLAGLVARLPFTAATIDPAAVNPFRRDGAADKALADLRVWRARRAWRRAHGMRG